MERIFQILAVILAGVAAFFLWRGNGDAAFISGVLGAVSFFLNIRFQIKEKNRLRELAAENDFEQLPEFSDGEEEFITHEEEKTTEYKV